MATEQQLQELSEVIRSSLRDDPGEIKEDTKIESLGIDSLELVEIIMTLEEKYDTQIEIDAVEAKESLNTIGDLISLAEKFGIGGTPADA